MPCRFVRIELPGTDKMLSLAEVQVVPRERERRREGTATQSSTDFEGPAHLAIDGNTNGDFAGGNPSPTPRRARTPGGSWT